MAHHRSPRPPKYPPTHPPTHTAAHAKPADVCEVKEKDVVDKATGLSFPIHKTFPYAGRKDFALLGAGPRKKNLFVAYVNVYSVGLYVVRM